MITYIILLCVNINARYWVFSKSCNHWSVLSKSPAMNHINKNLVFKIMSYSRNRKCFWRTLSLRIWDVKIWMSTHDCKRKQMLLECIVTIKILILSLSSQSIHAWSTNEIWQSELGSQWSIFMDTCWLQSQSQLSHRVSYRKYYHISPILTLKWRNASSIKHSWKRFDHWTTFQSCP